MSNTTDAAVTAAVRLHGALNHLGDALVAADLNGLLTAEAGLSAALASFRTPFDPPADPSALAAEVEHLRTAIGRCQRLGAHFEDFLRLSSGVLTPASAYDRAGREREAAPARVLEARY
ncbi:MAG: hypothetical protein AB7O67_14775 [Vicinamibacterales bacterium]